MIRFFLLRTFSNQFHLQVTINIKPASQLQALELKLTLRVKVLQWSRAAAGTNLLDLLNVFGRCSQHLFADPSLALPLESTSRVADHVWIDAMESNCTNSPNCHILGSFSIILHWKSHYLAASCKDKVPFALQYQSFRVCSNSPTIENL